MQLSMCSDSILLFVKSVDPLNVACILQRRQPGGSCGLRVQAGQGEARQRQQQHG